MKPLLSFIIPFFGNADKFLLERCINSIQAQGIDEDELEIIITGDDGKGVYNARNKGISEANGKYVYFVDADDYLVSGSLNLCFEILKSYEPDMLSFQYSIVHENDTSTSIKQSSWWMKHYDTGATYMLAHNFMGTVWRFIVKKKVLTNNGLLFNSFVPHEDEYFVAQTYFYAQHLIDISTTVYAYCIRKDSLITDSRKDNRKMRIINYYAMLKNLHSFWEKQKVDPGMRNDALERRIWFLVIDYFIHLWRNRCSWKEMGISIKEMKKDNLLPIRGKHYSTKFLMARLIINILTKF